MAQPRGLPGQRWKGADLSAAPEAESPLALAPAVAPSPVCPKGLLLLTKVLLPLVPPVLLLLLLLLLRLLLRLALRLYVRRSPPPG
jgi:hypothetical protein